MLSEDPAGPVVRGSEGNQTSFLHQPERLPASRAYEVSLRGRYQRSRPGNVTNKLIN